MWIVGHWSLVVVLVGAAAAVVVGCRLFAVVGGCLLVVDHWLLSVSLLLPLP